jgi:hypothetical protein
LLCYAFDAGFDQSYAFDAWLGSIKAMRLMHGSVRWFDAFDVGFGSMRLMWGSVRGFDAGFGSMRGSV